MELIRHRTDEGFRVGIVVKTGPVWMHIAYVCEPRLRKVRLTERRYMEELGEARKKDIKRINQCARRFGAKRKLV